MMKTYISLLRGINVSGQNKILMPDLKRLYESLNLDNVRIYIQTGNVVFNSTEPDPAILTKSIEEKIKRSYGSAVHVFLRDKNRFRAIVSSNPFVNKRNKDLELLHLTFLSDLPSKSAITNLYIQEDQRSDVAGNSDEFQIDEKEIYLFCPNGYGKTKLSNNFFERKLDLSATTRNWKTVNALYGIANLR